MYGMIIHKSLNNGPKIKFIASSERGDHTESKYIIRDS